ncbi:MipA/OmpV family protein [Thiocystis violascens]|uniref:Outer membrane protein V n=1 Tax=Thiocystis violascens (strain ATCC 17096 / DSM 198 / 6111) TaxID=765911 RepID=I3YB25_THIV6|nr:MipA/OmpV family protein [Thiocystis violascens]AFL74193.1 outer membrane protein V [Thiocystis violascens DSM 198]
MARATVLFIILLLVGTSTTFADAEERPLWEIGFGGGVIQIPDYRGSSESGVYPYPFVMPIYRGRSFQADEEGIKGVLGESNRLRLDVSFYGNVPVNGDNDARAGMETLDPLLEIGPMLRYKAWTASRHRQSLILDAPLRVALSLGDGVDVVGYALTPRASYRRQIDLCDRPWKWSISGELLWGSRDLHRYYYQVDPVDATAWRPAYDAGAGFGGSRLRTSLYRRDRNRLISLYAVYDHLGGAVFEDSPLVERQGGLTLGFVVIWFPFQSNDVVKVNQWEWTTE